MFERMLQIASTTVLSLMDRLGVSNVARQTLYLDAHLEQAIQLLLTGRCAVFEHGNALPSHHDHIDSVFS